MNYSPLRYPGGKTRITPLVEVLMKKAGVNNKGTYIEPFVGGAGVALRLLLNNKVERVVINDYDIAIYSFWYAILNETYSFISLIKNTPITIEEWNKQKHIYSTRQDKYSIELGFATFFLNRANRSGILSAGPIGGYKQTGKYLIDARFNKEKLIEKILLIAKQKDRISLHNLEIKDFIRDIIPNFTVNSFVYFDPPYFKKGKELYKNFFSAQDHKDIAQLIYGLRIPWMLTYDDVEEIISLYDSYSLKRYDINYSVANKGKNSEIIALSNNFWPTNNNLANFKMNIR